MKFKLGDKVKNIINGNIGKIICIDEKIEVNKMFGNFIACYRVDYGGFKCWNSIVELDKVQEILDEEEKVYLTNLIKPFKKRIKWIEKNTRVSNDVEFIKIGLEDIERHAEDYALLPNFKKGTMYKDMESNKEYTLKELNL